MTNRQELRYEGDKLIIAAARALHKSMFSTLDVYYSIHACRSRPYAGRDKQPSPHQIRAALMRNGAVVVYRGACTARPLYTLPNLTGESDGGVSDSESRIN